MATITTESTPVTPKGFREAAAQMLPTELGKDVRRLVGLKSNPMLAAGAAGVDVETGDEKKALVPNGSVENSPVATRTGPENGPVISAT